MELEIPRGRQARQAWRALSAQARKDAFAATSRGGAPSDVGVAWAAAGYGRAVQRRLRAATLLVPVAMVAVTIPVATALVAVRASPRTVDVVMSLMVVLALGGLAGLLIWARRYQRLHAGGLLGMEAARLGSLAPTPGQSVWGGAAAESEFTVPYHAQVPVPEPLARPVPDPAGTGVREIPLQRGRVLANLALLLVMALVLWLLVDVVWHGSSPPILATLVTVLAVLYTLLLVFLFYVAGFTLRRPVAARFTPDGWEIPTQRMSGPWAGVRAIRVLPMSTGMTASSPRAARLRLVALIVDDPQQHIAHLSAMRRAMARGNIRKYGSPVVIMAMPGRTMPVVDLVQLLQHYTPAPVEWDAGSATAKAAQAGRQ